MYLNLQFVMFFPAAALLKAAIFLFTIPLRHQGSLTLDLQIAGRAAPGTLFGSLYL
jgi:hypothetical protein